jgi:formate dehydrogenase major subunit
MRKADGKIKEKYHNVAKEINGYYLEDVLTKSHSSQTARQKENCAPTCFAADDGTSAGTGFTAGAIQEGKIINMMAGGKKDPTGLGLYPEWACAGL